MKQFLSQHYYNILVRRWGGCGHNGKPIPNNKLLNIFIIIGPINLFLKIETAKKKETASKMLQ